MAEARLITHLEAHLGPMTGGGRIDVPGGGATLQVGLFDDGPFANTACYCTLGLSHHRLRTPNGKVIRMELLMMVRRTPQTRTAPAILADVAAEVIKKHEPLLRVDVLGLPR